MTLLYSELIHPTAVIDPEAVIAPDVQIGPYAMIEGPVRIGPGCVIEAHACLTGPLAMGSNNFIGHGAVLGKGPQHRGYRGEPTAVQIGNSNVFREFVTVHRGTVQGNGVTIIGDRNMFMVGCHVGHDVRIANGCTVVNNALLGGHCRSTTNAFSPAIRPFSNACALAVWPCSAERGAPARTFRRSFCSKATIA